MGYRKEDAGSRGVHAQLSSAPADGSPAHPSTGDSTRGHSSQITVRREGREQHIHIHHTTLAQRPARYSLTMHFALTRRLDAM